MMVQHKSAMCLSELFMSTSAPIAGSVCQARNASARFRHKQTWIIRARGVASMALGAIRLVRSAGYAANLTATDTPTFAQRPTR